MEFNKNKQHNLFLTLFLLILSLPIYIWGESFSWNFEFFSLYLLFPLLGMLAFSIMWTQVVVGKFKNHFNKIFSTHKFFVRTGLTVLILFLSHPIVAAIAQWNSSKLLPIESLFSLVGSSQKVFITFAVIAFVSFVMYEFVLRMSRFKIVQRITPFVEFFSSIGVILVWVHSINIGSHLQTGSLRIIWWFYGITTILIILHTYSRIVFKKLKKNKK